MNQWVERCSGGASEVCTAALGCTLLFLAALLLTACQLPAHGPPETGPQVHTAPPPSAEGRYCAWFGDARGDALYFGMSSFWNAMGGAEGDPEADLAVPGPQAVGRFDLREEVFLPPLEVGGEADRTGVWDVLAHPDGSVWFSTYFGSAGRVEPQSGRVQRFPQAGLGLNELALGPGGRVLATRYGYGEDRHGSVVVFSAAGALEAEHRLAGPPGYRPAGKSLAYDPVRREIWVNTDLFRERPDAGAEAIAHDARVLDLEGNELLRLRVPEIQFMTFDAEGTGYFAELDGARLRLRVRAPERAAQRVLTGRLIALDDAFPAGSDFVQELRPEADGRVVVTRWSGRVHVVEPDGQVRDLDLPRSQGRGLYYTGVLRRGRLCATLCDEVQVTCLDID